MMMQVYENQRGPHGAINHSMGPVMRNQGPCNPRYMPFPANHRNQIPPVGHFQPQFLPPRPNFYPSPQTLAPPQQSVPHRQPLQGLNPVVSSLLGSLMAQGVISLKNQRGGGQAGTTTRLNPVPKAAPVPVVLPGLIDALLAQGVLKKPKEEKEDVVGCEFSGLNLNRRRESVVAGLYEGGLPSQCKTCGLRFKSQEEHSSHMDWHVKKNRVSKNVKHIRSRNYFATKDMWGVSDAEAAAAVLLCGAEKKRKLCDEDTAIPADEDQTKCALCADAFVEFYSHKTDEWMYKEAVYLNVPQWPAPEMERSQLGPIVHAECLPEASRKRLRMS
ncbi:polyadenylation and cleavage factor homolog 4-like [Argentina anserina]|uniref:polyadenylation and cleavage factor homolog 4-like n=1 Tax=Argentina anserina TaxID=57926 RepID=UPI00217633E6|nr:polyadenylation and cleavage factor homolog 4-like [Potentilla anserina]